MIKVKAIGKSVLVFLSILLFASTGLFANGSDEGKETGEPEVVTFFSGAGAYKELLEEQIAQFNNTTGKEKGIVIELQMDIDHAYETLMLAIKAGNAPDIYTMSPILGAENGWIKPLDDVPGLEGLLERFKPYLRRNININPNDGKTYVLPMDVLPIKMAYNKDLFKRAGIVDSDGNPTPPVTWDEVVDYAKRITEVGNGEDFGYGVTLAWHPYYWRRLLFKAFIPSIGHFYFDNRTGRYDFSSFRPAVDFILKIRDDKSYFPGPESIQIDPIRAQFSAGHIGMFISPAYDIGVFNDQFPAVMDWDVCDLPVLDPDNRYKQPMLDRINTCISSGVSDDRLPAVVEVFKFLHSKEFYSYLYANDKIIPIEQDVIDMTKNVQNKTGWKNMSDISKCYTLLPWPFNIPLEGPTYGEVMDKIWAGDISKDGIDEALADLDVRYNAALDKAVEEGTIVREDFIFDEDMSLK